MSERNYESTSSKSHFISFKHVPGWLALDYWGRAAGVFVSQQWRWPPHLLQEKGDEAGDISRLFIYYVGRKKDQQRKGQANLAPKDEGMSISGAISVLQLKGACLEENWPFDLGQPAVTRNPPWPETRNPKP
jgi:hypothetical protein